MKRILSETAKQELIRLLTINMYKSRPQSLQVISKKYGVSAKYLARLTTRIERSIYQHPRSLRNSL